MINDLKFIKGQEAAKRTIEIAVLGGHSVLLCGPSGKSRHWANYTIKQAGLPKAF